MKLTKIILLISGLLLGANANSSCGNGVKDLLEECDATDSTQIGWGNQGCNEKCKAIHGKECSQTFEYELRHGKKYKFADKLKNTSSVPIKIKKTSNSFIEKRDFNGKNTRPKFQYTTWFKNKKFILQPKEKGQYIKSINDYAIVYHPKKFIGRRDYKDIIIKYTRKFTKLIEGKEKGYFITTSCATYAITWCGDNILDSDYETCDDGNKKSGDGCSSTCQLEN